MDSGTLVAYGVKVVVAFVILLVLVMFVIWAERKVLADMQSRIGPNRAGPFGLLQSLADGIKLFMKEDVIPATADRTVFWLAPIVSMVPAFLSFSVVPVGDTITVGGRTVTLGVADLNVGILFFLAMGSVSVYGIALAGWSSGSKYPLLGAVRSSAQMISYEIAMGLSIIPVVLYAGTLSPRGIVEAQADTWFILVQFPAFVVFLLSGIAETNRAPFDLPEAETELVAGYHTEYSGVKFAMFFLAEYIHIVTISAIAVTLFLGGWQGPRPDVVPWLWPILWFLVKTSVFVFVFFWLRASLPRLRYDHLMKVGWKYLIPVALIWIPLTAAAQAFDTRRWIFIVLGVVVALLVISLFVPARQPAERAESAAETGSMEPSERVPVTAGEPRSGEPSASSTEEVSEE